MKQHIEFVREMVADLKRYNYIPVQNQIDLTRRETLDECASIFETALSKGLIFDVRKLDRNDVVKEGFVEFNQVQDLIALACGRLIKSVWVRDFYIFEAFFPRGMFNCGLTCGRTYFFYLNEDNVGRSFFLYG